MTTAEAARFLGLDRTTILKQVRAGRIPATAHQTPAGTQYTYTEADLTEYRDHKLKPGRKPKT